MVDQIAWVESHATGLPLGIAAAGLIHPVTGLALTANLPASGKAFPADIALAEHHRHAQFAVDHALQRPEEIGAVQVGRAALEGVE